MSLWAIVPVKPLNRAKSRLAEVLTPKQRSEFAEMMFRRLLRILADVPQIDGTLVISRDPKALSIARDLGAKTVQEGNPSDLNPALTRATTVLQIWRCNAVLVLPADLPFVTREDIMSIADMGKYANTVVLSTDHVEDGTNAMLIRPLGLIPYRYGDGSYQRHSLAAKLAGADLKIYQSDTIALDVDIPEDLEAYNTHLQEVQVEFLTPVIPDMSA